MESARLAPTSICLVVPVYVPETQQAQGYEVVRAQGVRQATQSDHRLPRYQ